MELLYLQVQRSPYQATQLSHIEMPQFELEAYLSCIWAGDLAFQSWLDPVLVAAAVHKHPELFWELAPSMRLSSKVALAAVASDPALLQWMSVEQRDDERIRSRMFFDKLIWPAFRQPVIYNNI